MKYIGFLCGAFSSKHINPSDPHWERVVMKEADRQMSSRFYYPEFVDFCFGQSENSIIRYVMKINKLVKVNVGCSEEEIIINVGIKELNYYQAPYDLCIFSIRVEIDAPGNDITKALSRLRIVDDIECFNKEFTDIALEPIRKIYQSTRQTKSIIESKNDEFCYTSLVEYGNKFKIFQIVVVDDLLKCDDVDRLLFELGTVSPIGSYNPNDEYSPSKSYLDKIIKDGTVSVFNNWKALSLFDTYTMLGCRISDRIVSNWIDNYYGMLYISELFVKFYLFRLNNKFRYQHLDAEKLLLQFNEFEYSCWFDNVSYNFLPRIMHHSMENGLEIITEKQRLYQMISYQKDNREKLNDQRMNNMLFYLTLFASFSMIWDASSLFNEMYPYEIYVGSNIQGFRLVAYALLVSVALLIIAIRLKKR